MLYFSSQSFTSHNICIVVWFWLVILCKKDREDRGWGGGGLKVISPLDGGGQEVILTLIQGVQLYFKAYFANFRTPPSR